MSKADKTEATTNTATAEQSLALGNQVRVQPAPGVRLVNNETGQFFSDAEPTLVHVTVTLLRRLKDQDLVLV